MDIKAIKHLSNLHSAEELVAAADLYETTGKCLLSDKTDPNEVMSDLLQAAEVKGLMEKGMTQSDAMRAFSQRVRGITT